MKKGGQVWVETVIYTLIAFALIGLVLGFAKPEIEKMQDKAIIEQSVTLMENIKSQIDSIQDVPGNKRKIELSIKKGELIIDPANDILTFQIKSRYKYSEDNTPVNLGNLNIITIGKGKENDVSITLDLSENYDITYEEKDDQIKTISPSSATQNLFVENKGQTYEWGNVPNICNPSVSGSCDIGLSLPAYSTYDEAICMQGNPINPDAYYCRYNTIKQTLNFEVE